MFRSSEIRMAVKRAGSLVRRMVNVLLLALLFPAGQGWASPAPSGPASPNQPQWLEPRGLSVVDLIGLVPEAHLHDAILVYGSGGIIQYQSGVRQGNQVEIQVAFSARYQVINESQINTLFNCLGGPGVFDQWPTAVPPAELHLFAGGVEVTNQVLGMVYVPAGQIGPTANPGAGYRYPQTPYQPASFTGGGALLIPANMGCDVYMTGHHTNLTGVFTFQVVNRIAVTVVGSEQFVFHSYIGPGNAGRVESLRSQMQARYGEIRHDKFDLNPPQGAEYILVTYPPTPVDPYSSLDANYNLAVPSGGTYRLGRAGNTLSVDHVNVMGLPLRGQWQDVDQAPGSEFLPFFSDSTFLATPEYFVPAGVGYDPCMSSGGCSAALLESIYNATMPITVYYYAVGRIADRLDRIPLRQVGPAWSAGAVHRGPAAPDDPAWEGDAGLPAVTAGGRGLVRARLPISRGTNQTPLLYLPLVTGFRPLPPDDPAGCPCGWFDADGRMLDFIPAP